MFSKLCYIATTVSQNNIGAPKMQKNHGSNCSLFQYFDSNNEFCSINACKVIALYLLCFFCFISSLILFFIALYIDFALSTINISECCKSDNYKGTKEKSFIFASQYLKNLQFELLFRVLGAPIKFSLECKH